MHISFTIPTWIFWILAAYCIIGLIAWAPMCCWASRFISPRPRGMRVWFRGSWLHLVASVLIGGGLLWPIMLVDLCRSEWRYGLGRKWRSR